MTEAKHEGFTHEEWASHLNGTASPELSKRVNAYLNRAESRLQAVLAERKTPIERKTQADWDGFDPRNASREDVEAWRAFGRRR